MRNNEQVIELVQKMSDKIDSMEELVHAAEAVWEDAAEGGNTEVALITTIQIVPGRTEENLWR